MEIVATRDIGLNEEVCINYGDRWESAWRAFRKEWIMDDRDDDDEYVPAFELNDFMVPVRTEKEQAKDPYPSNVQIICFINTCNEVDTKKGSGDEPDISIFEWEHYRDLYEITDDAHDCTILERQRNKRDKYNLKESVQPPQHYYTIQYEHHKGKQRIVQKVPRRAIEFFDKPYMSDQSLTPVFRHEIGLPDDMLPEAWKDYADEPLKPRWG